MANVIHRTTLQYLQSVNEPDYPEPEWKWSPDMSQVSGVEQKYWKWDSVNERPIPMTAQEMSDLDTAQYESKINALSDLNSIDPMILKAVVAVLVDEINVVRIDPRTTHPALTASQIKSKIRAKLEG